ncbi:DUF1636 family protein [Aquabacter cavernae]|uniref:DUF1636 family protein n=1 Tax=Aquabacter cavernae TaxID=2496029 RepID=UPI000F8F736B|nr:DUF1636 family protein [Aquabacter cavernae]
METCASASPVEDPAPDEPSAARVTLFVCRTCRTPGADPAVPPDGEGLTAAVLAAPSVSDVAVRAVRCLANCKRGLSAAMVRAGGWTYVFGDLRPDSGPDLMAGAALFAAAPDGLMPWRGRPDCLKRGMIARVPPLSFHEDSQ